MMTIPDPISSQYWRIRTARNSGIVHAFAPTGLTCCGHMAIRECVATGTERRCVACVAAVLRLKRAMRETVKEAAE
jgi:hypothetical protein